MAVKGKGLLAMDEGEEELRLEARTVQDCSIAVSHAVAIPPCRPPWHFKKGVRISDKLELEPLALVLEGGPDCWAVVHPADLVIKCFGKPLC